MGETADINSRDSSSLVELWYRSCPRKDRKYRNLIGGYLSDSSEVRTLWWDFARYIVFMRYFQDKKIRSKPVRACKASLFSERRSGSDPLQEKGRIEVYRNWLLTDSFFWNTDQNRRYLISRKDLPSDCSQTSDGSIKSLKSLAKGEYIIPILLLGQEFVWTAFSECSQAPSAQALSGWK